ncbi:hypothetical protein Nepgr_003332 [Nepenthes gracilis]|uniref:Cytochrome b561 domain-containing protein n=1 Tax=Nepenthes gracilis TaxID=150966 RepID=A0AAD3RZB0_NEPGR|nr:hypothetical protein Nepgr_003332 [Nepenthes gracilis]
MQVVLQRVFSSGAVLACFALFTVHLPFAGCIFLSKPYQAFSNTSMKAKNPELLSPEMKFDITLHGLLLWASMGFFTPVGVLIIRMFSRFGEDCGTKLRVLFYFHPVFQMLSVLLATAGAVMSIKSFENAFNNNHQRIGLSLYLAIWVQTVLGFCRPQRGSRSRRRSVWYFGHWALGTTITIVGIINIYTGLEAYEKMTSESVWLWTILFTAEVSFVAFLYLFQDKWDYIMQKQGISTSAPPQSSQAIRDTEKDLWRQPCPKANALRNLFN